MSCVWRKQPVLLAALVVWLGISLGGLAGLWAYAFEPGKAATAPQPWPQSSLLARATDRPTLVLFLHPHCPCSRATLTELAKIALATESKLKITIAFVSHSALDEAPSALIDQASAIPGAQVMTDRNGLEAQRFGATTSGHTVLYDTSGQWLFNGGITASRGHAGDNEGCNAIVHLVLREPTEQRQTPVYGCSLFDDP